MKWRCCATTSAIRTAHSRNAAGAPSTRRFTTEDGTCFPAARRGRDRSGRAPIRLRAPAPRRSRTASIAEQPARGGIHQMQRRAGGAQTMTCVSTLPAASPESECCTFMPVVGHLKRILRSMAAAALVRCRSIPSGRPRGIEMRQSEHSAGGVELIPYRAASSSVGAVTVAELRTPRHSGLRASFATAIWAGSASVSAEHDRRCGSKDPPTNASWWALPPAELCPVDGRHVACPSAPPQFQHPEQISSSDV